MSPPPLPPNEPLCLVCCTLPLENAGLESWLRLHTEISERGLHLVMLTRFEAPDVPFPAFRLPLTFAEFPEWFPRAAALSAKVSRDERLAELEFARWGEQYSRARMTAGAPVARAVLRAIVEELKPACVLVWSDLPPLSQCLLQVCQDQEIPVQVLERGLLPGTLMIERIGLNASSDVRQSWLADSLDPGDVFGRAFSRARMFYLKAKPQKYNQPAYDVEGLRNGLGIADQKVIVFFGGVDADSYGSTNSYRGRSGNPAFSSTSEAFQAIADTVRERENTVLVLKPHPFDHTDYSKLDVSSTIVVREANIHALIELADVVAAMHTTVQFETVFYGKPVLLMARSQWWGREATYEVNHRSELARTLDSALARRDWSRKEANARAFIVWLLKRFLIAWEPGVPAERGVSDFADFLRRFASDAADLPPAETRTRRLLSTLRALGRDYSGEIPVLSGARDFRLLKKLDEAEQTQGDPDSVAVWDTTIGETSYPCLFLSPQSAVAFNLPTGARGTLTTAIALHPDMWQKPESGPCEFTLRVNGRVSFSMILDTLNVPADRRWHEIRLEVPPVPGALHEVTFETRGIGSNYFRWALWRDPLFTWAETATP